MQRSLKIDLFATDEQRQPVLNSIRRYRHAARQCYAALLTAQVAGASLVETSETLSLKPDNDRAKIVLAAALDHAKITKGEKVKGEGTPYAVSAGSGAGYEMREWFLRDLMPTAMSFVWDSCRRDIVTVWTSRDPEHVRASRGWLAMQGARGTAQFMRRGIGFPVATGRPKLTHHELKLKWDREIGEIGFRVGRLDPGRYYPWKCLCDGDDGWNLGTIFLSERDGQLFATVTYERPESAANVDHERTLKVVVSASALSIEGPTGEQDVISLSDALGMLSRLKSQRERWEQRRGAAGSVNKPWGFRKAWHGAQTHLDRVTLLRTRFCTDCNHAWTRRIVSRAQDWRCGKVIVTLPDDEKSVIGSDHPWAWSQFEDHLKYKLEAIGAEPG